MVADERKKDPRGATAERLVASARGFLVHRGYNGFSYADVAEAVGIRKASIHHHFPAKVDLVRAVMAAYRVEIAASLARLGTMPPAKQLQAYAAYWATCIRDESAPFCVAAMLAAELPTLPEALAADVRRHFEELAAWLGTALAQGAKDGSLALTASAPVEADSFLALVHGGMLAARAQGDAAVFESITRAALGRLVVKGRARR